MYEICDDDWLITVEMYGKLYTQSYNTYTHIVLFSLFFVVFFLH